LPDTRSTCLRSNTRPAAALALLAAATALVLFTSSPARAQEAESFIRQQQLLDERLAEQRRDMAPADALFDVQWGGWIDYYTFHFDDGVQKSRLFQRPGLALWSRIVADDGAHEAFARVRLSFNHFQPGDEVDRQSDWEGPNFDRAWYQIDIGRALRLTDPADPYQMKVKIGRQEVTFGTGYALDLPLDAVTFDAGLDEFQVRGLFGKTPGSTSNIDRSPPVDSHSNRNFFGVEIRYNGFANHVPFAYALWNQDHTDERPQDLFQEYSYDTQYFGIGSRGSLAHNLNYWAEGVYESGRSYGSGDFRQRDYVDAWGLDAGVEYLWDHPMRPRAMFEYMFASGDQDRLGSPSSARGGNFGGREDTSFAAFGYRDTGIAASPTLSNIHVWKVGGSFAPLPEHELFRDLELGTNWFVYHKNRAAGAISDPTADNRAGYAGWEMDYYLNWRLASDLSWTVRWGAFFPGHAYSDRETRHFVFSGITWSF
jgi:hypothetical protein